jgi:hypothetical protein
MYELVQHIPGNSDVPKVVETVRGRSHAEHRATVLNEELTPEKKQAGVKVSIRKGGKSEDVSPKRKHRQKPDARRRRG